MKTITHIIIILALAIGYNIALSSFGPAIYRFLNN
jgi:predicted sugar kinase